MRSTLLTYILLQSAKAVVSEYVLPQVDRLPTVYMREVLPSRLNYAYNGRPIIRPASELMYGKMPAVPYPSVFTLPWMMPRPLTNDDLEFLLLMTSSPVLPRPPPYPFFMPYINKR